MDYQIVISGQIGSWWESCTADYVRYVLSQNKNKEVHVGFCSLGGYVKDGLEINQAFKDHGNVHAHAFGMNASISTIAMLGCKTIDIVKGSFFLIHNVSTLIMEWEQANKEQIDEMIKRLKKDRDDLKTFDDVLTEMYSEKTGKSFEECQAQMAKGNWMSAEEAVEFGLVDSIREDEKAEKITKLTTKNFVNSYYNITLFKDYGIPPLKSQCGKDKSLSIAAVVDENGNPTKNFIQKTWNEIQNLFRNKHADNYQEKNMIKVFACVMALLAMADGFKTDENDNISLSQDQMKKIDDELSMNSKTKKDLEDANKGLEEKLTLANKKVDELTAQLAKKDETIANLKKAPGDKTQEMKTETQEDQSVKDLYDKFCMN